MPAKLAETAAMQAGEFERAVELVEHLGPLLFAHSQYYTLRRWIEHLPHDLWATMFRHLGIDYRHTSFLDPTGRPMPILPYGEPITELL